MSLLNMQQALAHLYTDAPLRVQCQETPEVVRERFGLSASEQSQLETLDWAAVERFARSLAQKRLKRVKPHVPATCTLLGPELMTHFTDYCERFPLAQRVRSYEDALQFMQFLDSTRQACFDHLPYAQDVVAYEQTRLVLLSNPDMLEPVADAEAACAHFDHENWYACRPIIGPQVQTRQFAYPVDAIAFRLAEGELSNEEPDAVCILFARQPGSYYVHTQRIKASTRYLLSLCQGQFAIEVILEKMFAVLSVPTEQHRDFEVECRQFLRRLAQEGVITFAAYNPMYDANTLCNAEIGKPICGAS